VRYSITDVARAFGMRISALRYYDEMGLLRPAGRKGSVRIYGRADLRRLALIQLLHRDGLMSLASTLALLASEPPHSEIANRQVIADALAATQDQIERLQGAQHVLEHVLSCPRNDPIGECPVLHEQLDQRVAAAMDTTAPSTS
jgi:DNA-binding transcriptional MerR regulator